MVPQNTGKQLFNNILQVLIACRFRCTGDPPENGCSVLKDVKLPFVARQFNLDNSSLHQEESLIFKVSLNKLQETFYK